MRTPAISLPLWSVPLIIVLGPLVNAYERVRVWWTYRRGRQ